MSMYDINLMPTVDINLLSTVDVTTFWHMVDGQLCQLLTLFWCQFNSFCSLGNVLEIRAVTVIYIWQIVPQIVFPQWENPLSVLSCDQLRCRSQITMHAFGKWGLLIRIYANPLKVHTQFLEIVRMIKYRVSISKCKLYSSIYIHLSWY